MCSSEKATGKDYGKWREKAILPLHAVLMRQHKIKLYNFSLTNLYIILDCVFIKLRKLFGWCKINPDQPLHLFLSLMFTLVPFDPSWSLSGTIKYVWLDTRDVRSELNQKWARLNWQPIGHIWDFLRSDF